MGRIVGAAVAALLAVPALAQAPTLASGPVPPGIDRALWCASAFYWLAGSAEDSGDHDEAELYDGWSTRLLDMAGGALTSIEVTPEEIERLVAEYDQRALAELGTDAAPYDVATCPDLFGDEEASPAATPETSEAEAGAASSG